MTLASGLMISGMFLSTMGGIPINISEPKENEKNYDDIKYYNISCSSFESNQYILNDTYLEEKSFFNDIEKYNIILNFSKKILNESVEVDKDILEIIYDNFEDILL